MADELLTSGKADTSDTVTTSEGAVSINAGDGQKVTAQGNADLALNDGLEEVVITARVPKGQCVRVAGEPIGARQGRGNLVGCGISYMNNKLEHTCDASLEIKQRIGANKYTRLIFIRASRLAAKAINTALGADPTGQIKSVTEQMKKVKSYLDKVLKVIQKINDFIKLVVTTIQYIRAIVDWILSLPERFLQLLKKCLSYLINIAKAYLKEFIAEAVQGTDEGWKEGFQVDTLDLSAMKDAIKDIGSTVGEISKGVASVSTVQEQITEAVVNPTNASRANATDAMYQAYDQFAIDSATQSANLTKAAIGP